MTESVDVAIGSDGPVPRLPAFLSLCRVSNLPTVWMNVLTACLLATAAAPALSIVILMLSLSAFYCGGMALNDLFDIEFDTREQPFRPIPSGRITLGEAWFVAGALFALGLGALLLTPHPSSLVPGLVLLAVIFFYDRYHKTFAGSVAVMASTRFMVFVVSGYAISGELEGIVLAAGALQFGWTFAVTAVARHEGKRGEENALAESLHRGRIDAGRSEFPVDPVVQIIRFEVEERAFRLAAERNRMPVERHEDVAAVLVPERKPIL